MIEPKLIRGIPWAAGLLEAEGTFVRTKRNHFDIRVATVMTDADAELIRELHRIFQVGSVSKEYQSNQETRFKSRFAWTVAGFQAEKVMVQVLPYIGERKANRIRDLLLSRKNLRSQVEELYVERQKRNATIIELRKSIRIFEIVKELGINKSTVQRVLKDSYAGLDDPKFNCLDISLDIPTDTQRRTVEWLAGLIEGDGSFGIINKTTPRLEVSSRDLDIIQSCQQLFGGSVHQYSRPRKMNHNQMYKWYTSADLAESLMNQILPYMGTHRTEQIHRCQIARHEWRKRTGRSKLEYVTTTTQEERN